MEAGRLRNRSTTIKTSSVDSEKTATQHVTFCINSPKNGKNHEDEKNRTNQTEYLISIPFPWVSLGSVILPLSAFVYCIGEYLKIMFFSG